MNLGVRGNDDRADESDKDIGRLYRRERGEGGGEGEDAGCLYGINARIDLPETRRLPRGHSSTLRDAYVEKEAGSLRSPAINFARALICTSPRFIIIV